jgi:hypothetical protein
LPADRNDDVMTPPNEDAPLDRARRRRFTIAAGVAAAVAVAWFHIGSIGAPFGAVEINSGSYYGPSTRTYDDYGFGVVRGVPVYKTRYQALAEGVLYFNHPPGTFWLAAMFGPTEAGIRAPFVVCGVLMCAFFAAFAAAYAGGAAAIAAAAALALSPAFTFDGVTACDTPTGAAGLALLLVARLRPRGRGAAFLARATTGALAFLGAWLDWPFAWWLLALAAAAPGPSIKDRLRFLRLPWACGLIGAVSVFAWQTWAVRAPAFGWTRELGSLDTGAAALILDRPPTWAWLRGVGDRMLEGFPPIFLLTGLLALPFAATGNRLRAALVLTIPGAVNALVFAKHAVAHVQFVMWLGLPLAFGLAVALRACARRGTTGVVVSTLVALAVVGASARASIVLRDELATDFFKELGVTIDSWSVDRAEEFPPKVMPPKRLWSVGHNLPYDYAYYVQAPVRRSGVFGAEALDHLIAATPPDFGVRVLVMDVVVEDESGRRPAFAVDDRLRERLRDVEAVDVPSLKGKRIGAGRLRPTAFFVERARVFNLRDAR